MANERYSVLLVDDNKPSLKLGKDVLKLIYKVYSAPSAERMFYILQRIVPDVILLDIAMPDMDGFEAIRILKADARLADIPVIFLTAKYDNESEATGFDLGASDYVVKPYSAPLLIRRIENQIFITQQKRIIQEHAGSLSSLVSKTNAEVYKLRNAIISTMANLAELRDKYTGGHITRVQLYTKAMIEELLERDRYTDIIYLWNLDLIVPSVQMYDIGKIAIADSILNKPDKLNKMEAGIMRTHVSIGIDAVNRVMRKAGEGGFMRHALNIVASHHERWDGSGYPKGLAGEKIPLEARLVTLASVYDALISWRPYRDAYSHQEAIKIIEDGNGTQFDPVLVNVFLAIENEISKITRKYPSIKPPGKNAH